MKPEFDREIDALLRGQKNAPRGAEARAPSVEAAHMDADELSAYAEGALPPSTRSRYTAHLADCERCRRVFTSVALASGAVVAAEKNAAREAVAANAAAAGTRSAAAEAGRESKGATGWLAWLLSPRALRYAVPVLAVALAGVVAYVTLRSRQEERVTAARSDAETQQRPSAVEPNNGAQQSAEPPNVSTATTAAGENTNAGVVTNSATSAAPQPVARDAQTSGPVADASTQQPAPVNEITTDALSASRPAHNEITPAGAATTTAAPSAAPAAPKVSEAERAEARDEDAREIAATKKESDNYSRNTQRRSTADETPGDAANETRARQLPQTTSRRDAAGASRARGREAGALSAGSRRRGEDPAVGSDESRVETRAVAGYSFRRQDGAWVDARLSASTAASVVRRGSERFRTLAADFPELNQITSQLSGTVVVSLGGRAYRIN